MDFGSLIRLLRDERGWTQEKLAREAGITVTCLSNLERGATKEPNAETLERLAAALGLNVSELDPRRLGEVVAVEARSFAQRQAIRALLALSDRDVEAVADFIKRRRGSKGKKRAR